MFLPLVNNFDISYVNFNLVYIYRVSLLSYWQGKTTIKIFVIIERWASYNINHLVCSLFWFSLIWISISPFALLLSLSSFAFFCRSTFSLHSWLKMLSDKTKNMNKTGQGRTKKFCFFSGGRGRGLERGKTEYNQPYHVLCLNLLRQAAISFSFLVFAFFSSSVFSRMTPFPYWECESWKAFKIRLVYDCAQLRLKNKKN